MGAGRSEQEVATGELEREPLDLRLALGAATAWLSLLACATRSVAMIALAAGLAALLGTAALATRRRLAQIGPALSLCAFCVALVLFPLAATVAHARDSRLGQLARSRASVTLFATIDADPLLLAAKGVAGSPRVAVEAVAAQVRTSDGTWATDGSVLIIADAAPWRAVLPGQPVELAGQLSPSLDDGSTSVTFFARAPPSVIGEPPWWQRIAAEVRAGLRRAAEGLPAEARGLLPGLVDGDTSALDPVLAEHFRLSGLTHLVAVSGTNCSIVVGAVMLALRRGRVRPWARALLGLVVLVMFVVVARPSPSVLRAALTAVVALFALATGRPRAAVPALAAVTLGLLVWDPSLAGSASFALSVLATGALLVLAPGWAYGLRRRGVPIGIAEALAVAAAAHLATAPVVAAISGRVSLVAIPANVLAEPVVAATTLLGFGGAVLSPLWLPAAKALVWVAGWPCRWLVRVADFFGALHGATIPWPGGVAGGLALTATLLAIWATALRARSRRLVVAVVATCLAVGLPVRALVSGWPPSGWLFVACDVGQGDALVLNAGAGAAVEIDAGPDPVAIDRCLRDLRVTSIPLLVLTHYHLDHVAGLPGVARNRRIGAVLAGPLGEPAAGAAIVRAVTRPRGLVAHTPSPGTSILVGDVRLQVLGPSHLYRDRRSDPNNNSLMVMATVAGTRILLPGDAEVEEQQTLVAEHADLRADVLKVPHHGSAYFDPAFLAAAHAKVAVISVGLHNDYGHPSPLLLRALARLGLPTLRTDHDGDVAITGRDGMVSAVARGTTASTVGLDRRARPLAPVGEPSTPRPSATSTRHVPMITTSRAPSGLPTDASRHSQSSWLPRATCGSSRSTTLTPTPTAPSARSPPAWPSRSDRELSGQCQRAPCAPTRR